MSSSYAWSSVIQSEEIEKDDHWPIPTPGFQNPEEFDTDGAQVVLQNRVLPPEEYRLEWKDEFTHVDVFNLTDTNWLPGDTVYITVAALHQGDLTERVETLEDEIQDLDARITALENPAQR